MQEQKIPLFQSGNLVKYEMLELLKKFESDFSELQYIGYADGVIRGCDVTVADTMLIVNKGIILIEGIPFMVNMPVTVNYHSTNVIKHLVVRGGEWLEDRNYKKRYVDFLLVDSDKMIDSDIEICRFRLQQGARLRYEYRDFNDMDTEYDTVCLAYARWGALGKNSIAFTILKYFAKEMIGAKLRNEEDKMFINQIYALNGETLPLDGIRSYLTQRLNRWCMEYSCGEAYKGLKEVLRLVKAEKEPLNTKSVRERRILVD